MAAFAQRTAAKIEEHEEATGAAEKKRQEVRRLNVSTLRFHSLFDMNNVLSIDATISCREHSAIAS
jgi:hypothetical protein